MKKTTFRRQYILLLTLLFSYGFLFTSQYFDYSFSDEYAAIAFIITGISIFLVVFVYLREVKSASVLHTELYFKEVQLRETLNSLEEGVITTDMNGLIYDMNVSAERMTGWKKHEVINWPLQRVYNVVNEETGLPVQSIVSRILKYGKPIEFENNTILRGRNLDEIIISNSGSPLISSNGKVRGVVLVFRDISSNIEAENQLNQFKHFFNNSHDFACIAHLNGYFELLNPNFQKVLGYTNEEMLSAPFIHFIHPEDVAATLHEVEKLAGGALTINFTNRYRKKDSSYIWFEWNASPDKKTGKLYCIARDITERKAAQQAIDQLNKNLEIKIAERTAQLEVSKNEL
jgi:PAS domain S-box-containing protein